MAKKSDRQPEDPKTGKKRLGIGKILLVVFGVIILVVIGAFFYMNSRLGVDTKDVTLYPEGTALVIRDGKTLSVSQEFPLRQDDTIMTQDSKAKIVLFESVFVTIEENSKIRLNELEKDNIVLMQEEGRTYSKITGLFDVEKYSVQTPTGIASAQGTGFDVYVYDNQSIVLVSDGVVLFSSGDESINLTMLEKAEADGRAIRKTELTDEEKSLLINRLEAAIADLKQRRYDMTIDFMTENRALVDRAAEQYGVVVNEQTVQELFDDVDNGRLDLAEVKAQVESAVPFVNTELLEYLEESTQSIKKQASIISEISSSTDD